METQPATPQTGTQQAQPAPLPPPQAGDLVGLLVLLLFVLFFVVLGIKYVRRQKAEKLDILAKELEKPVKPDEEEQPGKTPAALPPAEAPVPPAPARVETREPVPVAPVAKPRMRVRDEAEDSKAYHRGLEKTRTGFLAKLNQLLTGPRHLDAQMTEELEAALIQADVGVKTASRLLELVKQHVSRSEAASPEKVKEALREEILRIVDLPAPDLLDATDKPHVVMVVGVNGTGKTTTIGKLAFQLGQEGKKVLLGAGDTFRAAATEQLQVWGQRANAPVVAGKEGQDPASVLFECVKQAKDTGMDFAIADTAGRLHTKVNLMEEIKKAHRVMGKAMDGAPHEVLLVVDAITGQNAVIQAEQFNQALKITGIVLTKLDGTAKGGVVIAIADQLKIPIRYVGVGEAQEDLRQFHPRAFVDGLFE